MRDKPFNLHLDDAACYRVHAQGRVETWSLDVLSGVWQISQEHAGPPRVTILVGRVLDQAALMGDLQQLYCLGLPLLSVECLGPANTSPARPA